MSGERTAAITVAIAILAAIVLAPFGARATAADPTLPPPIPPASEESSATTPVPLPLQMASTGDCRQLIIATAQTLENTTGTVQVFDKDGDTWVLKLSVSARFGKHGLIDGLQRRTGDKMTPTGIWRMPDFVFGTHRRPPKGTKMRYRRMDAKSWWSSKHGRTFNKWVEARHWTGEYIAGSPRSYEFAVSTGYNAAPNSVVYRRGTAIFLHVWRSAYTAGCVAISRSNMIRVCKLLDRSAKPSFAIGTLQQGTSTSIWAY